MLTELARRTMETRWRCPRKIAGDDVPVISGEDGEVDEERGIAWRSLVQVTSTRASWNGVTTRTKTRELRRDPVVFLAVDWLCKKRVEERH